MPVRDFLFKNGSPKDEFQKRKALLASYYFLIAIGVRIFFGLVNIFNPKGQVDMLVLFGGVGFSLLCLLMLRVGWVNTSIIAHLIFSNFMAFRFTYWDADQYFTGTYLFFIPALLWALAIFGYQQRWLGISFSLVSIVMFLVALLDPPKFHFADAHFFFIMNFIIIMVMGVLILSYHNREVFKSEQALRKKNEELEKTNIELDRFVYSASHDLRAPISSLLGLIQLYQLSPQQEKDKMVELMESRVRKLDEFVREIIQYSRNARQELNVSEFLPFELVSGSWERLRFMPQKIKVQFINRVDPLLKINHDMERVRMLVENLISNGIKYAKARPEPSFISVHIFEAENFLNLLVEDNGMGIEKSKQEKVFDMFYRAHENSDGSGLGLYIVKEMVLKMRGLIELTSDETKGTSIKIQLPMTTVPE